MRKNQSEKTSDFIEVNGTGTIALDTGYADTFVYGYFRMWGWWFIVHTNFCHPECVTVSEASTGRAIIASCDTIKEALCSARKLINEKRYYFSTAVGDILVQTRCDLTKRNTTNLQTLAIDTALWNV